jgi:16S rRNA (cytidine1402-2'-O)-methyltransferase
MSVHSGKALHYTIQGTKFHSSPLSAGLYLVATPIGNLGDITLRALETLAAVDTIYCEDTRVTSKLLARYQIAKPLKPYHDHNAAKVGLQIIELVSDAGTPLVSDPGFELVTMCIEENVKVEVVPGPSAAIHALALSGISADRFLFAGFLPAKEAQRRRVLDELSSVPATIILYETPHRILRTLLDMTLTFGPRPLALARDLTHEEILRGTSQHILDTLKSRPVVRGEITLVIASPAPEESEKVDDQEIIRAIDERVHSVPLSELAADLARRFKRPRREIYGLAMERKRSGKSEDAKK